MKKDPSKIPPGRFCYRVYPLRPGEVLVNDISRFGKELREFSYRPGFKEVLCPYWQRTEYGTIKCSFTNKEVLDSECRNLEESITLLAIYLDSEEQARTFPRSWELADEIKICGVNEDEDDLWSYDD